MAAFQFDDSSHYHGSSPADFRNKALLQVVVTEAFAMITAGNKEKAVAHITQYKDIALLNEIACYFFGVIFFNAEDATASLFWFNQALTLKPKFAEAFAGRAMVLQRLGRLLEALQSFEEILTLRPHDPVTLFHKGVIQQSLGMMDEALIAYEKALWLRPDYCEALTNRGAVLEHFGRFTEAFECFEMVAVYRPEDSANWFNQGAILQKLGRLDAALASYDEAVRLGPNDADSELNRGNVLQKLGRFEAALASYDQALSIRRTNPQALYNKGIALQELRRNDEALAAYGLALELDPHHCEAWCRRGNILHESGQLSEALESYKQALHANPRFLPALTNGANVMLSQGRLLDALATCEEALRHEPCFARALSIKGAILHRLDRLDEALGALDAAMRYNPLLPEVFLNRGNVLQEQGRLAEAIACYEEALRQKPSYWEVLSCLGVALKEAGRFEEALASFNEAVKLKPEFADARNNRAGVLLLMGRLEAGFQDYETRWSRSNAPPKILAAGVPQWQGEPLFGKRILIVDEQGLGDLIQFSRYLVCLAEAGADVTLFCREPMHRLLETLPKPIKLVDHLLCHGLTGDERFDFQSALMSLPFAFKTSLSTIPAAVPYLCAEPERIAKWAERIGSDGFRIGICSHGNARLNLQRTIPLAMFLKLALIPGVRLISLMKDQVLYRGAESEGWAEIEDLKIESLGQEFDAGPSAFLDCAAAMQNLDLIISSDTSIAHLSGALGRPTFVALKKVADWRWLIGRSDSPWYPTLQLFRQQERGTWTQVFDDIATAVRAKMSVEGFAPKRAEIEIPTAVGELIDKITILEIKENYIADRAKLSNVRHELALLQKVKAKGGFSGVRLSQLESHLKSTNARLWEIEDKLRLHEASGDFANEFIELARQVYLTNDRRAELKREINRLFNSAIIEEKSYSAPN
jgi:tetratricopeptide (TPR) repeat protein/ADP-heptose:LPS heptosyltransferase